MKLALIGEGIAQSQSPDLHQRLGRQLGVPTQYDLIDALLQTDFDFATAVAQAKAAGYRGLNITYPFKERAVRLADDLSIGVTNVGSTNTLLFEGDRIRAENTDYSGFIRAYRLRFQTRPPGDVLLLGAGGVGRAVACALGHLGVSRLYVVERDAARGQALCNDLCAQGINARTLTPEQADGRLSEFDGVVNCTPVGHLNHPGCPVQAQRLVRNQWVFDAVYIPARTELLRAAENAGAATLSGVDLFVCQGVDAFCLFAGTAVDRAALDAEVQRLREHYLHQLLRQAS
ncbi:MAG: shikimate dehydrogenase [Natronospirillum sp.]